MRRGVGTVGGAYRRAGVAWIERTDFCAFLRQFVKRSAVL